MKKKQSNQGFTLIELSIVTIIMGLMLVGAIQIYTIYNEKQKIERMNALMSSVDEAIQNFALANGHLPCPAPVNGNSAGNDFSKEVRNGSGNCILTHGVKLVNGEDEQRVLIGKIPAATLKISNDYMRDIHDNFLIYAVTETAASEDGEEIGGIRIIEEIIDRNSQSSTYGQIIEAPADQDKNNSLYTIVSLGATGKGAFAYDGAVLEACTGNSKEVENCDGDAVFVSSLLSDNPGEGYYDGRIVFKDSIDNLSGIAGVLVPVSEEEVIEKNALKFVSERQISDRNRSSGNGGPNETDWRERIYERKDQKTYTIKKDSYMEVKLKDWDIASVQSMKTVKSKDHTSGGTETNILVDATYPIRVNEKEAVKMIKLNKGDELIFEIEGKRVLNTGGLTSSSSTGENVVVKLNGEVLPIDINDVQTLTNLTSDRVSDDKYIFSDSTTVKQFPYNINISGEAAKIGSGGSVPYDLNLDDKLTYQLWADK